MGGDRTYAAGTLVRPMGLKRRHACCALSVDRELRLRSALTVLGSLHRLGWRARNALLLSSAGVHVNAPPIRGSHLNS